VPPAAGSPLKFRADLEWLTVALSGVSVAALLFFWWQFRRQRVRTAFELQRADFSGPQTDLAPHLTRVVKEVLVQELAGQRNELFHAQQAAVMELGRLTRQLDQSQAPVAERLRSYETRIQELETELAARTEENRELLKSRIEILRRQLAVERVREPVEFN